MWARRFTGLVLCGTWSTACIPGGGPRRIAIPVPVPAIGGSRGLASHGFYVAGEFGDGVWGQEQERIELAGASFGLAVEDRLDVSVRAFWATRVNGTPDPTGGTARVRLVDLSDGAASLGLHLGVTNASKESSAQDETMTAWDAAFPMTLYPSPLQLRGRRQSVGIYVAPRVVFERFKDLGAREETQGRMFGSAFGVTTRFRHLGLIGELNIVRTPRLSLGDAVFNGGWIVLPMARVGLVLPFRD